MCTSEWQKNTFRTIYLSMNYRIIKTQLIQRWQLFLSFFKFFYRRKPLFNIITIWMTFRKWNLLPFCLLQTERWHFTYLYKELYLRIKVKSWSRLILNHVKAASCTVTGFHCTKGCSWLYQLQPWLLPWLLRRSCNCNESLCTLQYETISQKNTHNSPPLHTASMVKVFSLSTLYKSDI